MGGAVSAGENNDELIDNLLEADYIKTPRVEKVFRAVDRGDYYLPEHRDSAYKDLAWKHGNIHLSAPCIYAEVLESLNLAANMSFLNLGSGTGYLSTLAGLVVGPYGVNHGVEYHADVIEYAKDRLEHFKKQSNAFDEFEFCEPQFTSGNCLLLNSGCRLYDRVYCGAACPPEHENYMKNLIKIGGTLVMPLNDQLLQITRKDQTSWETKSVLPVSFASLILPSKEKGFEMVELPDAPVMSLQELCRLVIRRILHRKIEIEHPSIGNYKRSKRPRLKPEKRRRINIVPTMILRQFVDDSDSDREAGYGQREGTFAPQDDPEAAVGEADCSAGGEQEEWRGERRRNRRRRRQQQQQQQQQLRQQQLDEEQDEMPEEEEEEEEEEEDHDVDEDETRGMPEILLQMMAMQRQYQQYARQERRHRLLHRPQLGEGDEDEDEDAQQQQQQQQDEDEDQGIEADSDEMGSAEKEHEIGLGKLNDIDEEKGEEDAASLMSTDPASACNSNSSSSSSSSPKTKDSPMMSTSSSPSADLDMDVCQSSVAPSSAIPIAQDTGASGRKRCFSTTSNLSTSYTSGIGTCSSVEEPPELDVSRELAACQESPKEHNPFLSNGSRRAVKDWNSTSNGLDADSGDLLATAVQAGSGDLASPVHEPTSITSASVNGKPWTPISHFHQSANNSDSAKDRSNGARAPDACYPSLSHPGPRPPVIPEAHSMETSDLTQDSTHDRPLAAAESQAASETLQEKEQDMDCDVSKDVEDNGDGSAREEERGTKGWKENREEGRPLLEPAVTFKCCCDATRDLDEKDDDDAEGEREEEDEEEKDDEDEEDDDEEEEKEKEQADEGIVLVEPGVTFKSCMQDKVELLPVPMALKQYLLFYRT